MNILLIEDDDDKIQKITLFLYEFLGQNIKIEIKKSYNSGIIELVNKNPYDIVLMDMSMPTYDLEDEDTESYAGRDLLEQMKFRKIFYPTIIITQYDTFGDYINKLTLEELEIELENKFKPNYRATVYYSSSENDWKFQLKEELKKVFIKVKD